MWLSNTGTMPTDLSVENAVSMNELCSGCSVHPVSMCKTWHGPNSRLWCRVGSGMVAGVEDCKTREGGEESWLHFVLSGGKTVSLVTSLLKL